VPCVIFSTALSASSFCLRVFCLKLNSNTVIWFYGSLMIYADNRGNILQYLLLVVGSGAAPSVRAVSPQVKLFQLYPDGRLPLLSTRPAVTFSAKERHRPLTSTKLYCLLTEAHRCEHVSKVVTQLCPTGNWTDDLLITSPLRHHEQRFCYISLCVFADAWCQQWLLHIITVSSVLSYHKIHCATTGRTTLLVYYSRS